MQLLFWLNLNWFCHTFLEGSREQWQFPRNTKADLSVAKDACESLEYFICDLQKTVQAKPREATCPVLQPSFFHLQCCRFILFEQSPWVNFLFASVCVLFVADTVPGQQL